MLPGTTLNNMDADGSKNGGSDGGAAMISLTHDASTLCYLVVSEPYGAKSCTTCKTRNCTKRTCLQSMTTVRAQWKAICACRENINIPSWPDIPAHGKQKQMNSQNCMPSHVSKGIEAQEQLCEISNAHHVTSQECL